MSSLDKYAKLMVTKKTKKFREATQLVEDASLPLPPPEGRVYVRTELMGVNATDVNTAAGVYGVGELPYPCGLEGIGEVVAVGAGVSNVAAGDRVMYLSRSSYAEYTEVEAAACVVLTATEAADPATLVMNLSGLTAACAVGELADAAPGEVALVTAAAGGTGQIAVQLLKQQYGCRVIGTCSTAEKAAFLRNTLGCDEVINYREEDLDTALTRLAPQGLNIVYECVGGATFRTCASHLAVKGRLIMIGAIDTYLKEGKRDDDLMSTGPDGVPITLRVLLKSASLRGFFLSHYAQTFPKYLAQMRQLRDSGKLVLTVDTTGNFKGVAQVPDAVEHLHSGKSFGKVVVHM